MKRAVKRNPTSDELAEIKPTRSTRHSSIGLRVRYMAGGSRTWIAGKVGRVRGASCPVRARRDTQEQPAIGPDSGIPGAGSGWIIRPDVYSGAQSDTSAGGIPER